MGSWRVYLYDIDTRAELKDHPANGQTWLQTSGNIMKDGKFVPDTATFVKVASYADLHRIVGEQTITAKDFPGRRIAVKIWHPDPGFTEWRQLVEDNR